MRVELKPLHSNNKSFYKKAWVEDDCGFKVLTSYTTKVCTYSPQFQLFRFNGSWSKTTTMHLLDFCQQMNPDFDSALMLVMENEKISATKFFDVVSELNLKDKTYTTAGHTFKYC